MNKAQLQHVLDHGKWCADRCLYPANRAAIVARSQEAQREHMKGTTHVG